MDTPQPIVRAFNSGKSFIGGGIPEDLAQPKKGRLYGKVELNGSPLENIQITLINRSQNNTVEGYTYTDKDGNWEFLCNEADHIYDVISNSPNPSVMNKQIQALRKSEPNELRIQPNKLIMKKGF